jgi:hypothetical protein
VRPGEGAVTDEAEEHVTLSAEQLAHLASPERPMRRAIDIASSPSIEY